MGGDALSIKPFPFSLSLPLLRMAAKKSPPLLSPPSQFGGSERISDLEQDEGGGEKLFFPFQGLIVLDKLIRLWRPPPSRPPDFADLPGKRRETAHCDDEEQERIKYFRPQSVAGSLE